MRKKLRNMTISRKTDTLSVNVGGLKPPARGSQQLDVIIK